MFKIEMCQEIESCHESRKVLQSTNTVPRTRRNDCEMNDDDEAPHCPHERERESLTTIASLT